MRRSCLAWLAAALLTGAARAETVPPPGARDARVRTVEYQAQEVYRLHGYVGFAIHLTFEAGEAFAGVSGGDLAGITWSGEQQHLFLKPSAPRVATNLTILTNKRAYEVDYSASLMPKDKRPADVTYALHFTYPPAAGADRADRALDGAGTLSAPEPAVRNSNYWFCGAQSLKPRAVWDDGMRTWIRFADQAEWPAIFAVSEDGEEALVNYTVSGADVIVHRLARRFLLRRGRLVACIQNRNDDEGGRRPSSGTASPEVERTVRGEP